MWPWRVKMPTLNLLRLWLLVMLMMRIVLATVSCRFGSWGMVIKQNFCSDFQHKVWSGVWRRSSGEILKLKFGQYFAADVWLRLQSWILVKILNLGLMLNQDFEIEVWSRFVWNLWYELNPRVRCAFAKGFGNVSTFIVYFTSPSCTNLGIIGVMMIHFTSLKPVLNKLGNRF